MRDGEVALVHYPLTYMDEEGFKKRPVLCVGGVDPGEQGDHAVLVAMITSNPERVVNPRQGDVVIHRWRECGLPRICVTRARRLWTPEPRDVDKVLGTLDEATFLEVLQQVRLLVSSRGA